MPTSSTNKREYTQGVKNGWEIQEAKSRLITALTKLDARGLKRDADRLGSIIGRLELWRNSR